MRISLRFLLLVAFQAHVAEYAAAQLPGRFTNEVFDEMQHYVGLPDSVIEQRFGKPDEVGYEEGKNAVVWTYTTKMTGEVPGIDPIVGYHQFAFWNGKVAGYRTRRFTNEEQAGLIYDSTLEYMGEAGRTILVSGSVDSTLFTADLRMSRRDDNLWNVDILRNALNSHATIIVGDVGYRNCRKIINAEASRIEKKFGIKVTAEGKIETEQE